MIIFELQAHIDGKMIGPALNDSYNKNKFDQDSYNYYQYLTILYPKNGWVIISTPTLPDMLFH
jgi:hypothetical protein